MQALSPELFSLLEASVAERDAAMARGSLVPARSALTAVATLSFASVGVISANTAAAGTSRGQGFAFRPDTVATTTLLTAPKAPIEPIAQTRVTDAPTYAAGSGTQLIETNGLKTFPQTALFIPEPVLRTPVATTPAVQPATQAPTVIVQSLAYTLTSGVEILLPGVSPDEKTKVPTTFADPLTPASAPRTATFIPQDPVAFSRSATTLTGLQRDVTAAPVMPSPDAPVKLLTPLNTSPGEEIGKAVIALADQFVRDKESTPNPVSNAFVIPTSINTGAGKAGLEIITKTPAAQPPAASAPEKATTPPPAVTKGDPQAELEKKLVDEALRLSWLDGRKTLTPDPDYKGRADCGVLTGAVNRKIDPDFPVSGTFLQEPYMAAHPEKYTPIENKRTTANLRPGDTFIVNRGSGTGANGHTFLYLGDVNGDGKGDAAAASLNQYMPRITVPTFSDSRGLYRIFRPIAAGMAAIPAAEQKVAEPAAGPVADTNTITGTPALFLNPFTAPGQDTRGSREVSVSMPPVTSGPNESKQTPSEVVSPTTVTPPPTPANEITPTPQTATPPAAEKPAEPPAANSTPAAPEKTASPYQVMKNAIAHSISTQESSNNPRSLNPSSGSSGLGNWLDTTWNNKGGYKKAMDAPADFQFAELLSSLDARYEKFANDSFPDANEEAIWQDVARSWYAGTAFKTKGYNLDKKQGNGKYPSINEYAAKVSDRAKGYVENPDSIPNIPGVNQA